MAIKLTKLGVSLTKHGASKLATLLRKFDKDQVLSHLWGKEPGVNIDRAQARKNLSVGADGRVPELWNGARVLGDKAVDALVLLGIVFSHYRLMKAMGAGKTSPHRGTIKRGVVVDGKAYSNFGFVLEELGFSRAHTPQVVKYDLTPLFSIPGLSPLALDLLTRKLRTAGWDGTTDAVDEMVKQRFNEALAITPSQFANWLRVGAMEGGTGIAKDVAFFSGGDEVPTVQPFKFRAGHRPRKTGSVTVASSPEQRTAQLLHNELQTALYKKLKKRFGARAVGTEVQAGVGGTTIDVVVQFKKRCRFYEIKIAGNLRACLRQAIPQLLEYAYWGCDDKKAERLIIVGTFALTKEARDYLAFLRTRFGLPIYYKRFKLLSRP